MGRSKNYETPETIPEITTDGEFVLVPEETEVEREAVVSISEKPNSKGIVLTTGNGFFKRLWLLISNPFRYLFTGKIYY